MCGIYFYRHPADLCGSCAFVMPAQIPQPPPGSVCSRPFSRTKHRQSPAPFHALLTETLNSAEMCPGFFSFLYRTTPKHGCFLLMSPWRCKQRSIFSTGADSSRCGVSVNQVCRSNCRVRSAKPQNPLSYDTKNYWTLTKYNAGRVKNAIFLFQSTKHEWRLEAWIKGWYLGRLDVDFSGMPLSPSFSVSLHRLG